MDDRVVLNEEEVALMTTAIWLLSTDGMVGTVRVREVWPKTSPWRWAPPVHS